MALEGFAIQNSFAKVVCVHPDWREICGFWNNKVFVFCCLWVFWPVRDSFYSINRSTVSSIVMEQMERVSVQRGTSLKAT